MTKLGLDLQGRLILVTRPLPEGESFCRLIESCNGRSLLAPALEIKPPLDSGPFESALAEIDGYDGIIITSANGARAFVEGLLAKKAVGGVIPRIFAVGKKTAKIVQEAGYNVTIPDCPAGGEELAAAIKGWQPGGGRLLFPRAEKGREELVSILTAAKYQVGMVTAYRAEPIKLLPVEAQQALAAGQVDAIPFFSARTGRTFLNALPSGGEQWLEKPIIITISQVTSRALGQSPVTIDLIAEHPTGESILERLYQYWQKHG
jgi:uroporphyrinogen-III synthase